MQPSPFTSQGYPFAKDLRSYDADTLGRAFFADGVVASLAGLHLYDAGNLLESSPLAPSLYYDPYLYNGRELPVYVYSSGQSAELAAKYELLGLRPTEVGIFAWVHGEQVELRVKLGAALLPMSRFMTEQDMRQAQVVRPLAELRARPLSASRMMSFFELGSLHLLDPAVVTTIDDLRTTADVIISRHEMPSYLRRNLPPPPSPELGQMDVVIGLFFDGTGNNRYATELIYNQVIDANTLVFDKKKMFKEEDEIPNPYDKTKPPIIAEDFMVDVLTDVSYLNAYSNVVLLHDLYQTKETYNTYLAGRQQLILKHYVQGIGTLVDLDENGVPKPDGYHEDDVLGMSSGRGVRGVIHRVEEAFAHVARRLAALLAAAPNTRLGVLTFDVFGFSRGATASRHCLNELLLPAQPDDDLPAYGRLGLALQTVGLAPPLQLHTRFAGLFDTVVSDVCSDSWWKRQAVVDAAIFAGEFESLRYENLISGTPLDLYVTPEPEPIYTSLRDFPGKAIHIVAADEHRENFPLTACDAPNRLDLYLPGVHADIGGSYASDQYNAVVAFLEAPARKNAQEIAAELNALAKPFRARFTRVLKNGRWVIDDPAQRTPRQRRILPELTRTEVNARTEMKTYDHYVIVDSALLSNKLALVSLQAMLTYARAEKLPFHTDPRRAKVPNEEFYKPPTEPVYGAYLDFILNIVAKPGGDRIEIPHNIYFPVSELYVHESAHYNRSLLFGSRGEESIFNIYVNTPNLTPFKQSKVGNQPTTDKRREIREPKARERAASAVDLIEKRASRVNSMP